MRGATDAQVVVVVVNEGTDALLIGRVTFEQMRGYWPPQTEDATGVRDHLDEVRKYVFSPILRDPAWERSTVLRGPLLEEVRKLKAQPGKAPVVMGSMSLMPELITGGRLRLAQARPFRSSIVLLRYCTVGDRGEPA